MYPALKIFGGGNPAALRWRRFSAVVGAAALVGVGTTVAASPAQADTYTQKCAAYHSWTECISYDWTNGNLAVNAINGYSTTETEALTITLGGITVATQAFDIPPGTGRGYAVYWGGAPADPACAKIDSITIVCDTFG